LCHQLGFAVIDSSLSGNTTPRGHEIQVDPDYAFGYGAYIGYRFPCSANDIRFRYFHLNVCRTERYEIDEDSDVIMWAMLGHADENFITQAQTAKAKIEFDNHSYDLEFAQHVYFCTRAQLRYFVGFSYHCINKKYKVHYLGAVSTTDEGRDEDVSMTSCFGGYGPRIGTDIIYAFDHGFGLIGHISTAMLYGEIDSKSEAIRIDADNIRARIDLTRCSFIPNVRLALGLDYSVPFHCGSVIKAEVGWWVSSYINAVNDVEMIEARNTSMHVNQLDNLTFHGFYLTLALHA